MNFGNVIKAENNEVLAFKKTIDLNIEPQKLKTFHDDCIRYTVYFNDHGKQVSTNLVPKSFEKLNNGTANATSTT